MPKPWLLVGLLLFGASEAVAQIPESMDPAAIPNYVLLRPGLATAGQPTTAALGRLKDQGFRTVVDLRMDAEGTRQQEEAILKGLGLRYVSVPLTAATITLDDVKAVAKVLDDPQAAPVLFHCASSNRVGGVIAVIEGLGGKTLGEAEAAGRKAGLRSPSMVEAVHRLLADAPTP
jgi:uncharacterized protein (TIGR01244 family)